MAAGQESHNLKPGTMIAVEVEQAVNNVLMVCLRSGGKIYRGALIDTQIGRCPLGISNPVSLCDRLKDNFDVLSHSESAATVVIMPQENGSGGGIEKVEHSALSYRQSYFQDMPLPAPRPILLNKPANFKEKKMSNSNARTRPIRLRPRRPLCSKCRSQCGNNFSASVPRTSGKKSDKISFLRKHKTDVTSPKYLGSVKPTSTGVGKLEARKTSPVIKISYASPHGEGHVMRIPAKTHSSAYRNSTEIDHNSKLLESEAEKEKSQRVIKKRKQPPKGKTHKAVKQVLNGFLHGSDPTSYHEQHRRIRIIKSEGTYHSASPTECTNAKRDIGQEMDQPQGVSSTSAANAAEGSLHGIAKTASKEKQEFNSLSDTQGHPGDTNALVCNTSRERNNHSRTNSISDSVEVSSNIDGKMDVNLLSDADRRVSLATHREHVPSLRVQVHKKKVTKGRLQDGREMCIGDIVWGKITGFPWWPGRIVEIVVSRHEDGTLLSQLAQITWFASTTISHMPLTELYPFLPFFTERYNRKKKGIYRDAVRQATEAATTLSAEVRALNTMFETSTLQP